MTLLVTSVLVTAALSVGSDVLDSDNVRRQGSGSTPEAASAQTDADEIRRRVKEGQKILIVDDQARELTGRIGELRADALMLLVDRKRTDVPYDRILRIDRPRDGLSNGALIGFGVGAALGLAAVISEESDDCEPTGAFFECGDPTGAAYLVAPLVLGGIGAGIGVAVDALIRREPNLYRRHGATRISLSPALARDRRGVAISVSW